MRAARLFVLLFLLCATGVGLYLKFFSYEQHSLPRALQFVVLGGALATGLLVGIGSAGELPYSHPSLDASLSIPSVTSVQFGFSSRAAPVRQPLRSSSGHSPLHLTYGNVGRADWQVRMHPQHYGPVAFLFLTWPSHIIVPEFCVLPSQRQRDQTRNSFRRKGQSVGTPK